MNKHNNCRSNKISEEEVSDILFGGSFSHIQIFVFLKVKHRNKGKSGVFQIIIVIHGLNMLYLLSITNKFVIILLIFTGSAAYFHES